MPTRLSLSFVAFALMLSTASVSAQTSNDAEKAAFENRLNRAIRSVTVQADSENAELNAHIKAMNARAPLEMRNTDSATISANISHTLEFIDYLTKTRARSDTITRHFEDSLYMIKDEMPADINASSLQNVGLAFEEDRAALNGFLDSMNKLYSDVLDVLTYLQHSHYSLAHNEFIFSSKTEQKEYNKRIKIVDADAKDLNKAIKETHEANEKANKVFKNPQQGEEN